MGCCPDKDASNDPGSNTKRNDTEKKESDNNNAGQNESNAKEVEDANKDDEVKKDDEIKEDTVIATRKEIRSLSSKESDRFFNAIKKMMENKNGEAGTSEFFRCASYHGQPAPIYCQHGRETFPGWHRIYLMDFELAIKKADKELGNDGNIGLPYWDWTLKPEDGLPEIVSKKFNWTNDLFPKSISNPPKLIRADNKRVTKDLERYAVMKEANDCLLNAQHYAHASTGNEGITPYPSIETPHNSVHVIVGGRGGPMGSVAWAAYDIAFWYVL